MPARRGRKPRFQEVPCPNRRCRLRSRGRAGPVVSNGTYYASGVRVRKFICRRCGRVFNSRSGTAFRWLHTPRRKVLLALRLLVKGLSLRGTAEVLGVKLDTVRRWLRYAAAHSDAVSAALLRELRLSQVQVDELWTFVKKNTTIPLGGESKSSPPREARAG